MKQSEMVRRVLTALDAAGWKLASIECAGEVLAAASAGMSVEAVAREFDTVEVATVNVVRDGTVVSHVQFVWQGPDAEYEDGEEVLSDYGVRLESVLGPLLDSGGGVP